MGVMLHEDGILRTMADRLRFATNVPLQDQSPIYKQRGYGVMQPIYTSYQSSSPSLEWEPHHNFRSHISNCCHLPCRVIQPAINEYDELRQFTDRKNKASISPKSAHQDENTSTSVLEYAHLGGRQRTLFLHHRLATQVRPKDQTSRAQTLGICSHGGAEW